MGRRHRRSSNTKIRVVVSLADGGRLRERFAPAELKCTRRQVNVDVVQVTVTVTDDAGQIRPRLAAVGFPRVRRRQAADDQLFHVGGRAARMVVAPSTSAAA